jgi:hypothetical protein
MTKYLVKTGINYGDDDRRADPGDIIDDIPEEQAKRALKDGYIERVKGSASRSPGKKAAATRAAQEEAKDVKAEERASVREQAAEAKERQEPAPKKKGGK